MSTVWQKVVMVVVCFVTAACINTPTRFLQSDEPRTIAVLQVDGASRPMALSIVKSVSRELARQGYLVLKENKGTATLMLRGQVDELDRSHLPRVAAISWILLNREGEELAFIRQSVTGSTDAWAYGSPALIRLIGQETAANLDPFLGDLSVLPEPRVAEVPEQTAVLLKPEPVIESEPDTEPEPVIEVKPEEETVTETAEISAKQYEAPRAPYLEPQAPYIANISKRAFGLWVDEVSGAPGDGNRVLSVALVNLLEDMQLPFARIPGAASHFIQGIVDVEPVNAATEMVSIVWIVRDVSGREIGRVNQRTETLRGALYENWGETALFAAQGGVEGILAILERDLGTEP